MPGSGLRLSDSPRTSPVLPPHRLISSPNARSFVLVAETDFVAAAMHLVCRLDLLRMPDSLIL